MAEKLLSSPKAKNKIAKVMKEHKAGKLHSGSKTGKIVKSKKQALAIALDSARRAVGVHGEHTNWANRGKKEADPESEITKEFVDELIAQQNHRCALTGARFDIGETQKENNYRPSVDRIDSNVGYKKHNVQLVCWPINSMKSNFPINEFIDMCHRVSAHSTPEYGIDGC